MQFSMGLQSVVIKQQSVVVGLNPDPALDTATVGFQTAMVLELQKHETTTVGVAHLDKSSMDMVSKGNKRFRTAKNKKAKDPSQQKSHIPVVDVNPNQPQNQTNIQSMD